MTQQLSATVVILTVAGEESAFDRFVREVEAEVDADPTGQARAELDKQREYWASERERVLARRKQRPAPTERVSGGSSAEEVWSRLEAEPGFNEEMRQATDDERERLTPRPDAEEDDEHTNA